MKNGQFSITLPKANKPRSFENRSKTMAINADLNTGRGKSRDDKPTTLRACWRNGIPVDYEPGALGPSVGRMIGKSSNAVVK